MKILFLDLEETIIDSIDSAKIIWTNLGKVMRFVETFNPDEIQTFSFALHSEMDKNNWIGVQKFLKNEHNLEIITQKFEVDELKLKFLNDVVGRVAKNELIDFMRLCSKDRVFEWMIAKEFDAGQFFLIDDTVKSKTVTMKRGSLTIDIINILDI